MIEQPLSAFSLGILFGATLSAVITRKHYITLILNREQGIEAVFKEKENAFNQQKDLLNEAEQKLGNVFESLSLKALRESKKDLVELAQAAFDRAREVSDSDLALRQQAVEAMLSPVKETLERLTQHSLELETKRTSAYDLLVSQVKVLAQEADLLSSALRRPQVRGSWGELALRTLCENCGLVEGEQFVVQDTQVDGDGQRLRPDVIIKLPGGRTVIIDAKCPLDSFRDALETQDEMLRAAKLKAHAKHVRAHVKALSAKEYWSQYEGSPDCTILFLPSEAAYAAALEADSTLLEEALKERILICNPMTVVGLVRAIAHVFADQKLKENAKEVRELGRKLYEALRSFSTHLAKHGRHLRLASESYNSVAKSFGDILMPRAERLSELGGSSGGPVEAIGMLDTTLREIPEEIVEGPAKNGSTRSGNRSR